MKKNKNNKYLSLFEAIMGTSKPTTEDAIPIECPNCPVCGSNENLVKNGKVRNKQRLRCKICKRDFVLPSEISRRKPQYPYIDLKMLAVFLYSVGFKPEEIFEHVINYQNCKIKNDKIVLQWAKKLNITETNIAKTYIINVTKRSQMTKALKEIRSQLNEPNNQHLIYIPLKKKKYISALMSLIIKENNCITQPKITSSIELLMAMLSTHILPKYLSYFFGLEDYNLQTQLIEEHFKNTKYYYTRYLYGWNKKSIFDLYGLIKNDYRKFCVILLDKNLENLNVYLFNITY